MDTVMGIINIAAVVTVHAVAVVATLFVILYSRSQWNRNVAGRSVMTMAFGFAVLVDEVTIRFWIPLEDSPYRRIADLATYILVLIGWLWLLITLIKAQRAAAREHRAAEPGLRLRRQVPWGLISGVFAFLGVAVLLWGVLHN